MTPRRWLSFHAPYACRHAGACCEAGWAIPIDRARAARVDGAVNRGRITLPTSVWLDEPSPAAGEPILARQASGACIFRNDRRCLVHGQLGPAALPIACQHFPRVVTLDPRGLSVTLSHFCPTAAALLFAPTPATIVEDGPWPLGPGRLPEGLDARATWPPLLSPGLLMDHEAYSAWEAHMVARLTSAPATVALAQLDADVVGLTRWRPGRGSLTSAVHALAGSHHGTLEADGAHTPSFARSRLWWFEQVRATVPAPLAWASAPANLGAEPDGDADLRLPEGGVRVIGRYLAARAFASWVAYQGTGVHAVVNAVRAAWSVLQVELHRVTGGSGRVDRAALLEALRQTDLLVVHHADPQRVADLCSAAGGPAPRADAARPSA